MNANKRKIINDPVLGFITIPSDLLYDLIQHPYFQRLNRIKQLGLTSLVYPGTQHTRFQHSLGSMHLMDECLTQLRVKGVEITEEETEGALAAILLHDIGHGPFSHVLEDSIVQDIKHEELSLMLIQEINTELNGLLATAIAIFTNTYPKRFLHQLVSGQLDMDRLDYLVRDSFYSGVVEGSVGADRIIKMLHVANDSLVVETKGIYSIENFLIARRLMYWQVYLHKTALAGERMLVNILTRAKQLTRKGESLFASPALTYFLTNRANKALFESTPEVLKQFTLLDDADITCAIKVWVNHPDLILSTLSEHFINRKLFKVKISSTQFSEDEITTVQNKFINTFSISAEEASYFFSYITLTNDTYNEKNDNIKILFNDGSTKDISDVSDILNTKVLAQNVHKYFLCYMPL